jgi:hypothetical protein
MPTEHDSQAVRESGEPVHRIPRAMRFARSGPAVTRVPARGETPRAEAETTERKTRAPQRQHRPDAG